MKKQSLVLIGAMGTILAGVAVAEHVLRRAAERRYAEVRQSQRQLELQYAEALATHEQLVRGFQSEQQRSRELFEALGNMRRQLEETVGRLAQELRNATELQARLGTMQHQLDQLQGELAVTLENRPGAAEAPGPSSAVQLERIVVNDAGTPALSGRVISIHPEWNFVVVNLGWDLVRIGDTISIFHDERLSARARIDRVQEGVSAATLLPEWADAEIHVNDLVRAS